MEFDRELVDLLPSYPIIWDRSRKDFRDNAKKDNAFKAMAALLNQPVNVVTTRYKCIREKYRKEKIRLENLTKSGASDVLEDTWELFESLSFLNDVMLPRKRASNIVPTELTIEVEGDIESLCELVSPSSSSVSIKRKRRNSETDITGLIKTLTETAASLKAEAPPMNQFDWLGKYISARLNAMDPGEASQKCDELIKVLINK